MNCAFYDKSMKLCAESEYAFQNIIGYRDIANLTRDKNGSTIFKMAANNWRVTRISNLWSYICHIYT